MSVMDGLTKEQRQMFESLIKSANEIGIVRELKTSGGARKGYEVVNIAVDATTGDRKATQVYTNKNHGECRGVAEYIRMQRESV